MTRLCLFLLSLLSMTELSSQGLLLNGGFEDPNNCTEYKIDCQPEAWISNRSALNNYIDEPARSYDGKYCMAIEAGHMLRPFNRTFIRSQLVCRLRRGNQYRFEIYVRSPHPILDSIGVYFGSADPLLEGNPTNRLPSFFLADDPANRFTNDDKWQRAVVNYTASGEESYVMIANFSRRDITGQTGIARRAQFFIFLDNISLIPVNPEERLCDNWRAIKDTIYDQNERHQYLFRFLKLRPKIKLELTQTAMLKALTDTLVLPDVLFATGKKDLQKASYSLLDSFCNRMEGRVIDSLVIEGHADNTGSAGFNEQLSSSRAEAIAAYLHQCRFFRNAPVLTRGWGSRKPVAGNNNAANRQRNRRVELMVYFRE